MPQSRDNDPIIFQFFGALASLDWFFIHVVNTHLSPNKFNYSLIDINTPEMPITLIQGSFEVCNC